MQTSSSHTAQVSVEKFAIDIMTFGRDYDDAHVVPQFGPQDSNGLRSVRISACRKETVHCLPSERLSVLCMGAV